MTREAHHEPGPGPHDGEAANWELTNAGPHPRPTDTTPADEQQLAGIIAALEKPCPTK